uniref:Uncharacterized protein n=2 Tax=Homalodisca TaxID=139475 RepID=A0A1B6HH04_9HEMI
MWVMPSSSARCAQLPRAADKVPFYAALKKFRDYLNGLVPELDEKEIVFTYSKLKNFFEPDVKEEPKDGQLCNYGGYNGRMGDGLTDLTNSVIKKENGEEQPSGPPKKKRGRPKKIKVEGEAPPEKKEKPPKEVLDKDGNVIPKKKRGRPKKIKPEVANNTTTEQQQPQQSQSNSSTPVASTPQTASHTPNCFSPPIQSPINLCQQGFSQMYNNQSHTYNQNSSQSPLSSHTFHQSPMQSHGYNQSPQPPSFTHSDLSSEISAAISSEQNIGSRSPNSSSLGGPPDFEPAATLQEENSKSSSDIKEENIDNHMDCHFSSPAPSKKKSPDLNYQNYDEFSGDSETNTSVRYPQRPSSGFAPKPVINQDVASKSLSGLESLVDQIPNIGDGETPHTVVSGEAMESAPSSGGGGQFSEDSAYLSDYPRVSHYSPQYPSAVPTTCNTYTSPSPSMNFSVTSLANSSATSNNETPGSFSVTSLASNYNTSHTVTSSYPNLMGPPHPMGSHHVIDSFGGGLVDRTCRIGSPMEPLSNMSGVNMSVPYPYNQYSSPYPGGPPAGFPYSPSHNIHVPSPNFPYPSPYSNSGYPQSSYLQSHVFDRIKNERMDIGFGGF